MASKNMEGCMEALNPSIPLDESGMTQQTRDDKRKESTDIIPGNHTINKLHAPHQHKEGHECIEQQQSLRRVVYIFRPDVMGDFLGAGTRRQ
jgi:hypothetical protein